jgi:hypothetical protein
MERILFGDNQFFGVNHVSDEKSRTQAIKFKDDRTILKTIDFAIDEGVNTFMCTTHQRIGNICEMMKDDKSKYQNFNIYPCLPYAHKYANAVTELGVMGTLKQYVPGNFFVSLFRGGVAMASKDYLSMMKLLIDAEMKMFKGVHTPVVFLQNVITDLLLGLGMKDVLKSFHDYIIDEYGAEPGYITMNLPKLLDFLESAGIENPIICSSINIDGFRMSGGKDLYEKTLNSRNVRAIAMQVLSGGASAPKKAIEYVCSLPNVESILFGASTLANIRETVSLIRQFDNAYEYNAIEALNNVKIY